MGQSTSSSTTQTRTLGVIGGGTMGRALLKGLLGAGLYTPDQVWAATKSQNSCEAVESSLGVPAVTNFGELVKESAILLLCVKPAQLPGVASVLRDAPLSPDTLVISILAGVTTQAIEALLGAPNPVVRAMPNTPSVIRMGMTVLCPGQHCKPGHLEKAEKIFAAVGRCTVTEERYFDAATAVSGSGPAYMYLILEALSDGGVRAGLPRKLALELAAQTMLGSAQMVLESGRHPASLRDDVTTPGGCTIGGLLVLEDRGLRSALARAVEEAARIAGSLGRAAEPAPPDLK